MADYGPDAPVDEDIRRLRECLSYDPGTGILRWKTKPARNVAIGDEAGCLDYRGYRYVRLDRRLFLAHRVAWALLYGAWPDGDLDHANLDKGDNRIVNLRLAPRRHNQANTPSRKPGLPKGSYRLKGRRRWYSQIKTVGGLKRLGSFAAATEAAAAFEREHKRIHGAFSRCEGRQ
jgi:hypothetical protein